jgi:hypothetical protein
MTNPGDRVKLCRQIAPYGKGLVFLAMMILLGSCEFFSTSLAPNQVRDPNDIIPSVTVDNIDDLTQAAEGRPDFAGVLLEEIVGVLEETDLGATEKIAKFQAGGLKAACDASAISLALLDKADVFLSESSSAEDIFEALQGMAQDVNTSVSDSLQVIAAAERSDTLQASEPEYLMIGAILLIMAEYKENPARGISDIVVIIGQIQILHSEEEEYPNLVAAIRLAEAAEFKVDRYSIIGSILNDLDLVEEWLP